MATYENSYAQKIYDIISPVLGDLMARGAIRSQCKKIGINEEMIQYKDIYPISENLKKALILFVGTENAIHLANKISNIN
jgi:hypothetical protein